MLASMGPIRTFLRDHRALAIWLVVLALAMKALVPSGYMIGAQSRTIAIQICDGQNHESVRHIVVVQSADSKTDHGSADHGKSDSVCPYTALGHASLAGADPALLATALAFILALAFAPLAPARLSRIPHIRPPLRGPPSQARLT